MRITKNQLKTIIAEEVRRALRESMTSDHLTVQMGDESLAARADAYDALAAALVDFGADDIITAMDMVGELEATASMGPLGAHSLGASAGTPGGELEAAFMNVVDVEGSVDEVALADAMDRLLGA